MLQIAFVCKGILGRKRQSILLLTAIAVFFAFIAASLCYLSSARTVQVERRYDLYGEWEAAQYGLTPRDAEELIQFQKPDRVGTVVQAGLFVGDQMQALGSIGSVDEAYLSLGRLSPLNGRFPEDETEIALTVNALDSLGYSYELGQKIRLTLVEADYLITGDAMTYEASFVLCGVLPSYEIFWNTAEQLPITAIVHPDAHLPFHNAPSMQVFYSFEGKRGISTAGAYKETAVGVYNDFAYPETD